MIKRLLLSLLISLLYISGISANIEQNQWKLVKQENKVTVYTQPISKNGTFSFKATTHLPIAMQALLDALQNVNQYHQWIPDLIHAERIKIDGLIQQHYVVTDVPWPFANRDGVYQLEYVPINDTGGVKVVVSAIDHSFMRQSSHQRGYKRVEYAEGYWLFRPDETGTQVTYEMHMHPGGNIPSWVIGMGLTRVPYLTLTNLHSYIKGVKP